METHPTGQTKDRTFWLRISRVQKNRLLCAYVFMSINAAWIELLHLVNFRYASMDSTTMTAFNAFLCAFLVSFVGIFCSQDFSTFCVSYFVDTFRRKRCCFEHSRFSKLHKATTRIKIYNILLLRYDRCKRERFLHWPPFLSPSKTPSSKKNSQF